MKAHLVRIGNSRGIRIPKVLIEQAGITDEVELQVEEGRIIISDARSHRRGWTEAAMALAEAGEDHLLDPAVSTRFEDEEWQW